MTDNTSSVTGRREPPRFRQMEVAATRLLTPRMIRVTFVGDELDGLEITEPAASVRILLPSPGTTELEMPKWNGNEFLLADASRPTIRTFTPRRFDQDELRLDIDMVVHEGGAASRWAATAQPGSRAALSGPGRGYTIDPGAAKYVLGGDETAIPAIAQLLERLPATVPVHVHIEVSDEASQLELPDHPGAAVSWYRSDEGEPPGTQLVRAVEQAPFPLQSAVWCAGEAAAMHRIRTYLFKSLGLPRSQGTVRGYWKTDQGS